MYDVPFKAVGVEREEGVKMVGGSRALASYQAQLVPWSC